MRARGRDSIALHLGGGTRLAEQIALRLRASLRRNSSNCASVSTPSAVVTMPRLLPSPVTARTMAMESSRVASSVHERTVDLDLVERETAQIAQRRIAGSEIIERNPDAEAAQLVQDRKRRLAVLQQHRFGDLQFEAIAPADRRPATPPSPTPPGSDS